MRIRPATAALLAVLASGLGGVQDEPRCGGRPRPHAASCFQCRRGPCISPRLICDGVADCPNADDEAAGRCGAAMPASVGQGKLR